MWQNIIGGDTESGVLHRPAGIGSTVAIGPCSCHLEGSDQAAQPIKISPAWSFVQDIIQQLTLLLGGIYKLLLVLLLLLYFFFMDYHGFFVLLLCFLSLFLPRLPHTKPFLAHIHATRILFILFSCTISIISMGGLMGGCGTKLLAGTQTCTH